MRSSKKVIKASAIKIAGIQSLHASLEEKVSSDVMEESASEEINNHQVSLIDQARHEQAERIKQIRLDAYEQGVTEGVKQGIAQQRQELAQLVSTLSGLINELSKTKKEFLNRMEGEVLNLAFAIAEKILDHEVATDKDTVCKVLGSALKKIVDKEGMKIRVNPVDYRNLTERKGDIFPGLEGIKDVMLEKDSTIGRGGAVIESLFGEVDARLDQQIGELKNALMGQ